MKKARTKLFGRLVFTAAAIIFIGIIALSFVPKLFGYIPCSVLSDSMEPAVRKGSVVFVVPTDFDDIKVSDILLFESPKTGECFTHRVKDIYRDEKQLVTAGDGNEQYDPKTTAYSCVIGRVVRTVPFIGYLSVITETLAGKIAILLFYIIWAAVEIEIYRSGKKGSEAE